MSMNFAGIPEPWGTIMTLIVGPAGAFVLMAVVIFFLWRLFREAQSHDRDNMKVVSVMSDALKDLTSELRIWREAGRNAGIVPTGNAASQQPQAGVGTHNDPPNR